MPIPKIEFKIKTATEIEIVAHLKACSDDFGQPLENRVNIQEYANKLFSYSKTFEAWADQSLVGLVAAYFDTEKNYSCFITDVSTIKDYQGKGIATKLLNMCIEAAKKFDLNEISLEVFQNSSRAINIYKKIGFGIFKKKDDLLVMKLVIHYKEKYNSKYKMMNSTRDYNLELEDTSNHKYAYNFDFDVMHPFMLRAFEPFFEEGSMLELGSFKGNFTKKFLPFFKDITCVEASETAIALAKKELIGKVHFICTTFENANLPQKYDNIVVTHVLEHLDDPVLILKRINNDWLSEKGKLFLVCPNANAPSRQIAVKMGLISHNSAITPAEKKHGHRITYCLDTLERDARMAGLNVIYRTGIFFKALANFQWDKLLETDIISPGYLEGCYQLGQQYPDLCSSIFLLCEKGK